MLIGAALVLFTLPALVADLGTFFGTFLGPLALGIVTLAIGVILALWADARAWSERVRG